MGRTIDFSEKIDRHSAFYDPLHLKQHLSVVVFADDDLSEVFIITNNLEQRSVREWPNCNRAEDTDSQKVCFLRFLHSTLYGSCGATVADD